MLVVTRAFKSSLDLDFVVMVLDLLPVMALIERAGRLWRHMYMPSGVGKVLHIVSPDPGLLEDDQLRGCDRLVPHAGAGKVDSCQLSGFHAA